jgi:hypothetical protein
MKLMMCPSFLNAIHSHQDSKHGWIPMLCMAFIQVIKKVFYYQQFLRRSHFFILTMLDPSPASSREFEAETW